VGEGDGLADPSGEELDGGSPDSLGPADPEPVEPQPVSSVTSRRAAAPAAIRGFMRSP